MGAFFVWREGEAEYHTGVKMIWAAYGMMTLALVAAVALKGGVYPQQWAWSAVGISAAALMALASRGKEEGGPRERSWAVMVMGALLGYMALQMAPLPAGLVEWLSPERWKQMEAARAATGMAAKDWMALSVAPGATFERLLDVTGAMAGFLAAREMGRVWRQRAWLVAAPVMVVAWMESVIGLAQYSAQRATGGAAVAVTGTYVNRNHFAGLLEMGFPLAVMMAGALWRKGTTRQRRPAWVALGTVALLGAAGSMLAAVVVSLSRMGFLSTLAAVGLAAFAVMLSRAKRGWSWRLAIPAAVVMALLIFLPTKALVGRFAELAASEQLTRDTRLEIWRDTIHVIGAYKWTGCGLGAYERGLYAYKTVAPTNTVDFAHNDYLQILAELGIPGAALAAALGGMIFWDVLQAVLWNRRGRNWELAVGLLGALLAMGIHSLADFNLYIPANALALAWLSGLVESPAIREG